ncbi:outer membrane protein assembly factor BamD [mine drainage metagenome]|uniref:Outer membrane protein assembly factor BamD n=1 Tax=mine drainage metagenome TaxID=410659 RepID=A0A1J5RJA2_9ZZZZ
MPLSFVRALRALCLASFVVCFLAIGARADIVWSPSTGWRIEGGVLSGLSGREGRRALDYMNRARTQEEHGSYFFALHNYKQVVKKYPNSIYAPEATYHMAKIYLTRHQYIKAFQEFQTMVARYPNSSRFNEVIGEEYRIASALLDGARNRIWGWIPGFKNRQKGIEYFQVIVANAPYSDYAPLALMNIARGQEREHNTDEAIDALDRMINGYSDNLLAPDAYLQMAKLHASLVTGPAYDQAETKDALTYYQDFMILFPHDPNIAVAAKGLSDMKTTLSRSKIILGDFYFYYRDNFTAAKVFYNEAITNYPDSPIADLAKKRLAAVDAKMARLMPKPGAPMQPPRKKHFLFF